MTDPKLVVIFLRGGADGLALVSPSSDPNLIAARPEDLRVLHSGDGAGTRIAQTIADVDFQFQSRATALSQLYDAVLAELLSGQMGTADLGTVFPGYVPTPLGLWT